MRESEWREKLDAAAATARLDLERLRLERRSAPGKVLLAAYLKRTTAVSNGWLAAELRMGRADSVSQYVRRFRLAGGEQTRAYRRLFAKRMS